MVKLINSGNNNKNEYTINTSSTTDRFQRHYADGRTQSQKVMNYTILFIRHSRKEKTVVIENRPVIASYEWSEV